MRRKSKQFQISCKTLPGFNAEKEKKDRMERISVKEMKKLAEALEFFGCVPDQRILWSFELYMRRVLEWNEHVNLTAIRDQR